MASFDWADFVAPLEPSVLVMSAILGFAMGVIITKIIGVDREARTHLWWQLSGGMVDRKSVV